MRVQGMYGAGHLDYQGLAMSTVLVELHTLIPPNRSKRVLSTTSSLEE